LQSIGPMLPFSGQPDGFVHEFVRVFHGVAAVAFGLGFFNSI
jgi:hypothetical protein